MTAQHATMKARILSLLFRTAIQRASRPGRAQNYMLEHVRLSRSRREREGLNFDVDKSPADLDHAGIKVGGLRTLRIGKETPDPGRKMVLENFTLRSRWRRKTAAGEARHDLAQDRGMILRLRAPLHPLYTEARWRLWRSHESGRP
jgi:hypothetical protein